MSIIIFLIILSALVLVHELGHWSAAKYFGIRVDEFGLGYPPRAKKLFKWKGTDFTLNWLPFGGFVKIFGENPEELTQDESPRKDLGEIPLGLSSGDSFQSKNRGIQAGVLFAGVFFNFLFAWGLISGGFIAGLPAPMGLGLPIENERIVITAIIAGSPADEAGLKSGDIVVSINGTELSPEKISEFISDSSSPIDIVIKRGGEVSTKTVVARRGILEDRQAVGISMELIGIVKLPTGQAVFQGLKITWELTIATTQALLTFISQAFVGRADLSTVTGPVGIVGMVGDVSELGFSHLLTFTALISINLALINLLPFPALDGGRLFFVGIEAITRRRIPPRLFNALNAAGFFLLIFLMLLVTFRDIRNIF